MRERGLKSFLLGGILPTCLKGRSREGAWIEIPRNANVGQYISGRSREGAWIEMICRRQALKGVVGRSREGAWIEM